MTSGDAGVGLRRVRADAGMAIDRAVLAIIVSMRPGSPRVLSPVDLRYANPPIAKITTAAVAPSKAYVVARPTHSSIACLTAKLHNVSS